MDLSVGNPYQSIESRMGGGLGRPGKLGGEVRVR